MILKVTISETYSSIHVPSKEEQSMSKMIRPMWAMVTTMFCVSEVLLAATSVARVEATFVVVSSTSDSTDINLKDEACDVDESVPGSHQVSDTYTLSNTITGNSIYDNTRFGIALGSAGPIRNNLRDPDVGPNGLHNRLAVGCA